MTEFPQTKVEGLRMFFQRWGDFVIWRKPFHQDLIKWTWISKATDHQIQICNLRGMHNSEILLDDDLGQKDRLVEQLIEDGYSFAAWDSGGYSNSYHIHLVFPELAYYEEMDRRKIRKFFIEKYECDISKSTGVLALEGELHFKGTGRRKTLVYVHDLGNNKLPEDVLTRLESWKAREIREKEPIEINEEMLNKDPFLQYCLSHKIPPGIGRYNVVCKNLAVLMVRSGISDEQINSLVNRILENMPDRRWGSTDFEGWINAVKKGTYTEYNQEELFAWFQKHKGVLP